ncbi:hypothetical protein A3A63_00890 [Candidatus Gottesmanbacteria bacterium RIFCSPLOWO2_01_FULL_46_9]|uniref:Uncharacterized protein n=1 Tax=Candidatus Gottesmanbacteria bacterium RIFCSPLOWO2_01_FULL_46_9 TaxID=1798394 RepID=A0A1F6AZR3_9BACT|nr:MAG: hypothetical protein A3A63_00890 [Candidatus Gottesmanbacteria bacterium RIFCSPLOWO2_01_FULL_46_9]
MKLAQPCHVFYSPIGSIPFLGYLFLLFQIVLLRFSIVDRIYVPQKEKIFLRHIIKLLSKEKQVVVHTFRLGFVLRNFSAPIVLDIQNGKEYTLVSDETYNQILWSLIYASEISSTTSKILQKRFFYDFRPLFPL